MEAIPKGSIITFCATSSYFSKASPVVNKDSEIPPAICSAAEAARNSGRVPPDFWHQIIDMHINITKILQHGHTVMRLYVYEQNPKEIDK